MQSTFTWKISMLDPSISSLNSLDTMIFYLYICKIDGYTLSIKDIKVLYYFIQTTRAKAGADCWVPGIGRNTEAYVLKDQVSVTMTPWLPKLSWDENLMMCSSHTIQSVINVENLILVPSNALIGGYYINTFISSIAGVHTDTVLQFSCSCDAF